MEREDAEELYFMCAVYFYMQTEANSRKKRKYWSRSFLRRRNQEGAYRSILNDLRIEDRSGFRNFVRMTPVNFENLLQKVAPYISKQNTHFRDAITPAEQLAVCLRYLATGDSYSSLMYLHRISKTKISQCVPEVCEAIIKVLKVYLKVSRKIKSTFNLLFLEILREITFL